MEREKMLAYILDAYPYPIVYVDSNHIIRYMNKAAEYHYYSERGYRELIGRSIFECHNSQSEVKIHEAVEKLKKHGNEIYLGVSVKNQRIYINPVRNEAGELIGYFERFELNLEK
ncbi:PAS domain-containing protein [Dendrosporobacter sp. 1207_IL3150]|uniref:PAS domain-containing protein n=1 Tax=Dendrosporobacter sp. 1207_IL3150 TaxID=3084054 RepID=UPI002FDA10BE